MSVRGNQFKSNSFKQDNDPSTGQKPSATRTPRQKLDVMPSFDLKDGRFVKIVGLLFIIISIYFLVAFTSYLFTWQDDQSYVIDANGGWSNLFKTGEELQNSG